MVNQVLLKVKAGEGRHHSQGVGDTLFGQFRIEHFEEVVQGALEVDRGDHAEHGALGDDVHVGQVQVSSGEHSRAISPAGVSWHAGYGVGPLAVRSAGHVDSHLVQAHLGQGIHEVLPFPGHCRHVAEKLHQPAHVEFHEEVRCNSGRQPRGAEVHTVTNRLARRQDHTRSQ